MAGVLLMGLVPPYEAVYTGTDATGERQTREMFIRYALIGRGPSADEGYAALFGSGGPPRSTVRVRVDAQRLVTQVIALAIVVVALALMMPGGASPRGRRS